MFQSIINSDYSLFFAINGITSPFFDNVMWAISGKFLWIPLYIYLLFILYKTYPKKYWSMLLVIAVLIALNDQTCNLFKYNVARLRPSHDPYIQYMVHTVNNYRGGLYGFYSGHAANTAAVAFFIISLMGKKQKWLIPVLLMYTFLTGYSRIYLGVHFPADVMAGFTVGGITGYFGGKLYLKYYSEKLAGS